MNLRSSDAYTQGHLQLEHHSRSDVVFQHDPLDHTKHSLRLVRVLQDLSEDGLIQCEIMHTTIYRGWRRRDVSWNCLSYMWGDPDPSTYKVIRMNGRGFKVRHNLFDFLALLQSCERRSNSELSAMSQTLYWIDALCIDQMNTLERNHQVAQMGNIFACAQLVHIWLGKTPCSNLIRNLILGPQNITEIDHSPHDLAKIDAWRADLVSFKHEFDQYVVKNDYWDRAWVTQEIVLADTIRVSLDCLVFSYPDLFLHAQYIPDLRVNNSFYRFDFRYNRSVEQFRGCSLLYLLSHFNHKKCSVPQDRIFSLLSLCDEKYKLKVDYEISTTELAHQVMGMYCNSLCVCAAITVAKSLRLRDMTRDISHDTRVCVEIEIEGFNVDKGRESRSATLERPSFGPISNKYRFIPPVRASTSKCLRYWLRCFTGHLNHNLKLQEHICAKYAGQNVIPFGDFFSSYAEQDGIWTNIAKGWRIAVRDKTKNVCAVRVALSALPADIGHLKTSAPTTSRQEAHRRAVRAMRTVYVTPEPVNNL